jgi:hypothetical protein
MGNVRARVAESLGELQALADENISAQQFAKRTEDRSEDGQP